MPHLPRLVLLPALTLLLTPALLHAAETKFDTPDSLKQLEIKNKPDSLAADDAGGEKALTFSAPKQVTVIAFLTADGTSRLLTPADSASTEVKFLAPGTSLGLCLRTTPDGQDGYTVLLNTYPKNGGLLRVYRCPTWPQKNLQNVQPLVKKNLPIPTDKWLKLSVTTRNTDAGAVEITATLSPADSDKPLATATATDAESPLKDPGSVALRLYGADAGAQVRVRSLTVTPDSASK